jgi:cysteinyl-tRNA synthetase
LRTHYRSTVLFNEPAIEEAGIGLDSFLRLFKRYTRITGKDFYQLSAPATREAGAIKTGDQPALVAVAACRDKFLKAMDDDFNTGGATGELFELVKIANKFCDDAHLETENAAAGDVATLEQALVTLKELTHILGIFTQAPTGGASDALLAPAMQLVIDLRAEARANKNFATADAIRDGMSPLGLVLEDRAGGTEWSGGDDSALEGIMQLLITLRQTARENKDFATSDTIRDRLTALGVTLEDRAGGTEWSQG